MLAYIIPTRNRPEQLAQTLAALAALPPHAAQVVVIDNASSIPPSVPLRLTNGLQIELILNASNEGAAARNRAALVADPAVEWLIMLDDDSAPLAPDFIHALREHPADTLAVAAEISLSHGGREAGGLPEVFVGCGAAIRRQPFLDVGGYDPSFNYYAEEYDLAAKLLLAGGRVSLDRRFRVQHRKVAANRCTNTILRRLVRNNAWVMQRYAPDPLRRDEINRLLARYAVIAAKEQALTGYIAGELEWKATARRQHRSPMSPELFDRFTGLDQARQSFHAAFARHPFGSASIIDPGKNDHIVRRAIEDLGVTILDEPGDAEVLVLGTLSPGPLLDAWERRIIGLCGRPDTAACGGLRILSPWHALTTPPASPARPIAA